MSIKQRIAAIDIGTNSVLLTIAEYKEDGTILPLHEEAHITRLGEGLGNNELFASSAMERTSTQLKLYADTCHEYGVGKIRIVGTAAFRRSRNADDFIRTVKEQTGLAIEIISGEREAELSFSAAAHDFGEDILALDIGGGSTEFIWNTHHTLQTVSIPIGSVVLCECYIHSDPINDQDYQALKAAIQSELLAAHDSSREAPKTLVALAGTATTLVAMHQRLEHYSHDQVHGSIVKRSTIEAILTQLLALTIEERKQLPGLEPGRADVIPIGATLLCETMDLFGYDQVTISDRGVRWGLLYEALGC